MPYSSRLELRNRDEVIETLKSNYPPLLQAAGVGGTALVWLHVQKDGSVAEARIIDSSGRSELDDAALRVSRTLRFVPAQSEGKPVPVRLQLPITFKAQ